MSTEITSGRGLERRKENVGSEVTEEVRCPICGSTRFVQDYQRGEIICEVCGYVFTERIVDRGPEWRAFTPEEREKRSRVGSPLTRLTPDSLVTMIDWKGKDYTGRELSLKRKLESLRWRKWQIRIRMQTSIERNLAQAVNELQRIGSQLGLPRHVMDQALDIYRQALEKGLVRGRSIESIMAAAIYAACRMYKIPRTLDEIARYTKSGRKDVARCYRLLLREINLKVPLADPIDYVPRIAEQLKLSGMCVRKAIEILKEAKKRGLTAGKDPAGLAAAAIYIASLLLGEVRTQKEIAQAARVTEVTVRNRYKELAKELDIKIPMK